LIKIVPKTEQRLFQLWIAVIAGYFLWSRLDFSDRIYYTGDGNVIVGLIKLILESHDWDADWNRLVDIIHVPEVLKNFAATPDLTHHSYNLSGYTVIGAVFCKIIYSFNFIQPSIQKNIHFLNVIFQLATLPLVFLIGKKIANRYVGLLAILFFSIFPLAIAEAHYERPEAWLCLLTTAIVYFSLKFEERPIQTAACIGVLIGLSIVTKFSQIFLGIVPVILLINHFFLTGKENLKSKFAEILVYGIIILIFMTVFAFINTPFIFKYFPDYLATVSELQNFYAKPAYPFAEEHYHFFQQLCVILYYFYATLGGGWLFCLGLGIILMLTAPVTNKNIGWAPGFIFVLPLVFLIFLFSLQVNFIERNFASVIGLISLLSAIGFYNSVLYVKTMIRSQLPRYTLIALLALIVLYPASKLGFLFVKNHIKQPDYSERIIFQNELKKDFHEFWIKNIFITSNILNQLPELPNGSPRIYHVEDLNEYTTRNYLANMKNNGFTAIAEYCSDFYNLPPGDFTIYHARARDHYLIKNEQWPTEVARDYFKTNCP